LPQYHSAIDVFLQRGACYGSVPVFLSCLSICPSELYPHNQRQTVTEELCSFWRHGPW